MLTKVLYIVSLIRHSKDAKAHGRQEGSWRESGAESGCFSQRLSEAESTEERR